MSTINNMILGDDDEDEESETEFNPGAERDSEDGQSDNDDRDTKDGIAPKANGEPIPERVNGSRPKSREPPSDELKDEDEDEGDLDNGEDDEGEGEDLGNGDDDDEEDEDEDEDDEDAVTGRPRKRRRRGLNQFIEEEAEVDDEDDEELEADEDDVAETGFIQDTHPDDDLGPEADQDDRRHRELDRQRQMEASLDAEAAAQRLKERYGRRTTQGLSKGSFVPQNLLMPSVDDPSIWGFKCKPGKEREIVMALTKKIQQRMAVGRTLKICSAFERAGPGAPMQGFIFVEAKRKQDAEEALDGISDVYKRMQNLVPVKEMPDLLRVKKSKPLEIGAYVRIRRGPYGGDLGMVNEYDENGMDVEVRLVPRLDYGLNEDANRPVQEKRKRAPFAAATTPVNRPPQRLFNENEAKKRHSRILQNTSTLTSRRFIYDKNTYADGFLLKTFKKNALETEKVDPKLEEITKLTKTAADGSETLDLETLAHSLRTSSAEGAYVPGDEVEVYQGEQRGIIGKVEGVNGSILRIKVSQGELTGQIVEQPVKGVRKRFKDGDHVKVIGSSRYNGEVGMVLRIKDDRVTVLTDTSMQEITVFSKDLREAAEAGGSDNKSIGFDVQDLVQINATEVGIVIKADQEAVRILDENSSVITRLPSQLQPVEIKKNAVATDRNGSEIRVGDIVREAHGESKSGRILHIHRAHVFVHDRQKIEDAGLWTTRCMNVVTISSKANVTQPSGPDLTKMNPALGGHNGASMPPPAKTIGRDRLIDQLVHIRKGPYKGHKGLVKETTTSTARVELQSKNKTINVEKVDLAIVDKNTNKTTDYHTFANSRGPPRAGGIPGSRIPDGGSGFLGSRTPAAGDAGGRTPAWGASSARTPAWSGAGGGMDSGRTPAWKPSSGSQTSYGGAGGMTSYGGAGNYGATGSRTPAWSASARTPYSGSDGFGASGSGYDAYATSSRTPYGGAGTSRTPAWGGPNSNATAALTPAARPYDAPTPAISAPTPGGFDNNDGGYTAYGASAPTPGAGFGAGPIDAPTPGFTPGFAKGSNREELKYNRLTVPVAAATPAAGGYDAPTPAAGGPRYADDDDDE